MGIDFFFLFFRRQKKKEKNPHQKMTEVRQSIIYPDKNGLFATNEEGGTVFRKGEIICQIAGRYISKEEYKKLHNKLKELEENEDEESEDEVKERERLQAHIEQIISVDPDKKTMSQKEAYGIPYEKRYLDKSTVSVDDREGLGAFANQVPLGIAPNTMIKYFDANDQNLPENAIKDGMSRQSTDSLVFLVALQNINQGEEIVVDYGLDMHMHNDQSPVILLRLNISGTLQVMATYVSRYLSIAQFRQKLNELLEVEGEILWDIPELIYEYPRHFPVGDKLSLPVPAKEHPVRTLLREERKEEETVTLLSSINANEITVNLVNVWRYIIHIGKREYVKYRLIRYYQSQEHEKTKWQWIMKGYFDKIIHPEQLPLEDEVRGWLNLNASAVLPDFKYPDIYLNDYTVLLITDPAGSQVELIVRKDTPRPKPDSPEDQLNVIVRNFLASLGRNTESFTLPGNITKNDSYKITTTWFNPTEFALIEGMKENALKGINSTTKPYSNTEEMKSDDLLTILLYNPSLNIVGKREQKFSEEEPAVQKESAEPKKAPSHRLAPLQTEKIESFSTSFVEPVNPPEGAAAPAVHTVAVVKRRQAPSAVLSTASPVAPPAVPSPTSSPKPTPQPSFKTPTPAGAKPPRKGFSFAGLAPASSASTSSSSSSSSTSASTSGEVLAQTQKQTIINAVPFHLFIRNTYNEQQVTQLKLTDIESLRSTIRNHFGISTEINIKLVGSVDQSGVYAYLNDNVDRIPNIESSTIIFDYNDPEAVVSEYNVNTLLLQSNSDALHMIIVDHLFLSDITFIGFKKYFYDDDRVDQSILSEWMQSINGEINKLKGAVKILSSSQLNHLFRAFLHFRMPLKVLELDLRKYSDDFNPKTINYFRDTSDDNSLVPDYRMKLVKFIDETAFDIDTSKPIFFIQLWNSITLIRYRPAHFASFIQSLLTPDFLSFFSSPSNLGIYNILINSDTSIYFVNSLGEDVSGQDTLSGDTLFISFE